MTPAHRAHTASLLALVLFLTSLTVAHARGQVAPAGERVLCLGGHAVTVFVDADGNPVEYTHVCSDFAASFFIDAGQGFVPSALAFTLSDPSWRIERVIGHTGLTPSAQARGPPLS
jgi:hypothetical protein